MSATSDCANCYTSKYPRSVSKGKYRLPLDHPDCEQLGEDMEKVYQSFSISDTERSRLIKSYTELVLIDKLYANSFMDYAIPAVSMRPCRIDYASTDCTRLEHAAGYFWRVREYLSDLQLKCSRIAGEPDDI